MKKLILISLISLAPLQSRADLWGADLPLLAEIVFNTLHTMYELQQQTQAMNDELEGIKDRIDRIRTISDLVRPDSWDKWKDPREAVRRLKVIYHTMPKEYRTEKYDSIEGELSKAMNLVARVSAESQTNFESGKELERRGANASPGVAQKLTASGVGTLIALESQSQIIQSQITSLLTQMMADANDKETRSVVAKGQNFGWFSKNLGQGDNLFSRQALALGVSP